MLIAGRVARSALVRSRFGTPAFFHASHGLNAKVQKTFKLADIGEGITECEVLSWNVKTPAKVDHFDLLCEVQSDKASVEITSPYQGVVTNLLVKEGEIAKVGEGLCTIEIEEDELEAVEGAGAHDDIKPLESSSTPTPQPETEPKSAPPPETDAAFTPDLAPPAQGRERRKHPLDPEYVPPSTPAPKPTRLAKSKSSGISESDTLATPSVRHFARSLGIPRLAELMPGSGKGGRIERVDVEAWLKQGDTTATSAASEQGAVKAAPVVEEKEVTVELGRTRWAMWKAMEQSLKIPHFGYSTILDLTNLHHLIPTLNANIPPEYNAPKPSKYPPAVSPASIFPKDSTPSQAVSDPNMHYERLTFLPLLIKALSRAMQEWPLFRSSISQTSPEAKASLVVRPHADIAIALSTPSGLYTPVIQKADTKTAYDLMGELRRLSNLGRTIPSGLTPKEMPKKGATLTVSNVGAIGAGEFAAPLLVPGGGVAIVAIGRAKWVQREEGKRLEVGVSWSADHRVVEGAEMAAFTERWRLFVENPGLWAATGR